MKAVVERLRNRPDEEITGTALYADDEEKQEWEDLRRGQKLHITLVRTISEGEKAQENEIIRSVVGRVGAKTEIRKVAIAITMLGEKAKGLKDEPKVATRAKREDNTTLVRIIIDRRGCDEEAWKLVQRDPERAAAMWFAEGLDASEARALGESFAWNLDGGGGGRPHYHALQRLPKTMAAKVLGMGSDAHRLKTHGPSEKDYRRVRMFIEPMKWSDEYPAPWNRPCNVKWRKFKEIENVVPGPLKFGLGRAGDLAERSIRDDKDTRVTKRWRLEGCPRYWEAVDAEEVAKANLQLEGPIVKSHRRKPQESQWEVLAKQNRDRVQTSCKLEEGGVTYEINAYVVNRQAKEAERRVNERIRISNIRVYKEQQDKEIGKVENKHQAQATSSLGGEDKDNKDKKVEGGEAGEKAPKRAKVTTIPEGLTKVEIEQQGNCVPLVIEAYLKEHAKSLKEKRPLPLEIDFAPSLFNVLILMRW